MKNLFGSLVDRLKRKEDNLTFYENLVDKTWQQVDNSNNVFRQLEFQRNGVLLDTIQGDVSRKNWELTGSGKISIKSGETERLYYAKFVENFQLSLSPSGNINSAEIFWEEKHLLSSVNEFLKKETERKIQEEKRRLEEHNKTMDELALKNGMSRSTYEKWEDTRNSILELKKLSRILQEKSESSPFVISEIFKAPLTAEKIEEMWNRFEIVEKAFKKFDEENKNRPYFHHSRPSENHFSKEKNLKLFLIGIKEIDQALSDLEKMKLLLSPEEYREKRFALKFSRANLVDFLNFLKKEGSLTVPDLE